MSGFSKSLLEMLTDADEKVAWESIASHLWEKFSADLPSANLRSAIVTRDQEITELENAISSACWDLWHAFPKCIGRCSEGMIEFWNRTENGKAVLILDGLSLREIPMILKEARARGFEIRDSKALGAELPCNTNSFAKALGFASRAHLSGNDSKGSSKLSGAKTVSDDLNWKDAESLVGNDPNVLFWHHFPDAQIHEFSKSGKGLKALTSKVHQHFSSNDFWKFIERLATGRRLIITSDHGYAACELFPDLAKEQAKYMKTHFKNQRFGAAGESGEWFPPVDLQIENENGKHRFALGRRKWRGEGGYPNLQHGGLSLLEMFVPFVELTKPVKKI